MKFHRVAFIKLHLLTKEEWANSLKYLRFFYRYSVIDFDLRHRTSYTNKDNYNKQIACVLEHFEIKFIPISEIIFR